MGKQEYVSRGRREPCLVTLRHHQQRGGGQEQLGEEGHAAVDAQRPARCLGAAQQL